MLIFCYQEHLNLCPDRNRRGGYSKQGAGNLLKNHNKLKKWKFGQKLQEDKRIRGIFRDVLNIKNNNISMRS